MTGGYPCIKIVIYSPEGANQAKIMGTQFEWGKYHWAVGPSNRYTIELDKPYEAALYLVNANGLSDAGIVEMTLMKNVATIEEATEKQYVATMYGWSMYGTDELDGNGYTSNSLYELSTHKRAVVAEYSMEIHSYPVITQSGMASWWANSANATQVAQFKLLYDQWVFYYDPDNGKYYRWNGSSLVEQPYNIYIKARDQSKDEFVTPINIQAMQSGAVLPEINYDDPDDIYLSMTNAVFVQLYYQTQSTEYTIESTLPALQDKAKNVKESYETWAAYAFNMEKVNTASSSQMNSPYLFIFTDDGRFAQVDKATYNDKYTNRNCYRPYSGIFSKQSIQNARQLYRTHLAALDEALELNLQEG